MTAVLRSMFTNMIKSNLRAFLLIVILALALILRIYKLDQVPPAVSWDEAAVGYNAWSIANFGVDEWGKRFPLYFKSFEDDKHPLHIYLTAPSIKLLGLNDFSTRLPAAIFGVFNVLMLYLLGKKLFKSEPVGLSAALFLAISPYNLQFSRYAQELNFTVFFFMLGLFLFYKSLEKEAKLLPFGVFSFCVSLLGYHSAEVVVPPIVLLLLIFYFKRLVAFKGWFFGSLLIPILFIVILVLNPPLLGLARLGQTSYSSEELQKTPIFKQTHNETLTKLQITYNQYLMHLSPKYLFESGDPNPRHSIQTVGEFYKIDGLFLVAGSIALLFLRSKAAFILLVWALLAPLPAAAVKEAPHASRAMFTTGSFQLIAALGFVSILEFLKQTAFKVVPKTRNGVKVVPVLQITAAVLLLVSLGAEFKNYLNNYYNVYPKKYAIEWQFGMKQVTDYIRLRPDLSQVWMSEERHQPYIFFLYYLKTPPAEFLSIVHYNTEQSRSYNLVDFYTKYYFGNWNFVESMPNKGVLYVLTPSQYSGLRYRAAFDVQRLIYYPNGNEAFYLVEGK